MKHVYQHLSKCLMVKPQSNSHNSIARTIDSYHGARVFHMNKNTTAWGNCNIFISIEDNWSCRGARFRKEVQIPYNTINVYKSKTQGAVVNLSEHSWRNVIWEYNYENHHYKWWWNIARPQMSLLHVINQQLHMYMGSWKSTWFLAASVPGLVLSSITDS